MAITIALGLASRHWPWFGKQPGDVLYATLAYAGLRWLLPSAPPAMAALGGFCLASAVEFAKLWHAPWLEAIRSTTLGGLVLGHQFLWSDFVCYAVGALLGWALDTWQLTRTSPRYRP